MRALLLTAATALVCSGSVSAQYIPEEPKWEIGLNAGLSNHTRPLGPAVVYQGTRTKTVHEYSARLNYYINERWMVGLDIGERKWQSWADWSLPATFGQKRDNYEMSFLIANHAISESIHINYMIPFYTQYMTYNKANVYFGVMAGMVTTVNDGGIEYAKTTSQPDSGQTYVSSYHYGFGVGYNFGAQVGFTYYLVERLGINIELACRYANVGTNDNRYNGENKKFYLLYFPETVGLRWRL